MNIYASRRNNSGSNQFANLRLIGNPTSCVTLVFYSIGKRTIYQEEVILRLAFFELAGQILIVVFVQKKSFFLGKNLLSEHKVFIRARSFYPGNNFFPGKKFLSMQDFFIRARIFHPSKKFYLGKNLLS